MKLRQTLVKVEIRKRLRELRSSNDPSYRIEICGWRVSYHKNCRLDPVVIEGAMPDGSGDFYTTIENAVHWLYDRAKAIEEAV